MITDDSWLHLFSWYLLKSEVLVMAYHSTQHMFTGSTTTNRSTEGTRRVLVSTSLVNSYTDLTLLFTKFQLLFDSMVCVGLLQTGSWRWVLCYNSITLGENIPKVVMSHWCIGMAHALVCFQLPNQQQKPCEHCDIQTAEGSRSLKVCLDWMWSTFSLCTTWLQDCAFCDHLPQKAN